MASAPHATSSALLPAYLVVGPDELKRDQTLRRLRARVDGPFADFNLDEVQAAPDLEPATLVDSLNMLPMGGALRVVIVRDAEKLPKPVQEAVIAYLADPNPACVLALVAAALAKTTRLRKAVAKLGAQSVIECPAPKARDLPPYVQRLARSHGVTIDLDAASELVARVGDSTTLLDTQVSTLAELLGGSGRITRALVEEHVARVAEVKPWDLLDALSARDLARSLELVRLVDGSALGLLSLVTGRVRELICARSLAARGQGRPEQVAAELKRQSWQVKNHVRWARGFAEGGLEHALAECAATERALKSGANPQTALVRLVVTICQA